VKISNIDLKEYEYDLPSDRIAQYPAVERDLSRLLVYKDNNIHDDIFRNIDNYLPSCSLLVFNNTRVIRARFLFRKETGAVIEILCLEPLSPVEYELSFSSLEPVEWKCIVGNLKKWKHGLIKTSYLYNGCTYELTAKRTGQEGDAWRIRFEWGSEGSSFGEVIDLAGQLPLPPYIEREAGPDDLNRYQTIYSRYKGSVAAPTAGLHFTEKILERLKISGTAMAELTLHVGAGTFKPIKSSNISEHEMHREHFLITRAALEQLLQYHGHIIAIGTTSVRTLESLYWLAIKLKKDPSLIKLQPELGQWDAYEHDAGLSNREAIAAIMELMDANDLPILHASTSMMIIPGYKFRMISGMVTNFHQPGSSLLLLISALVGEKWKEIYRFALDNNFRFLSYGDCSLLLK
jgi:S-adenosylmethionine:tRNA ribosyltransferase-isomerase